MKNELALYSRDDAMKVAKLLVDNGYVVLMSTEEDLTIINYLDGDYNTYSERVISDRNAVVFMSREDFDTNYVSVDALQEEMRGDE